jgi:hypothetical protein
MKIFISLTLAMFGLVFMLVSTLLPPALVFWYLGLEAAGLCLGLQAICFVLQLIGAKWFQVATAALNAD